MHFRKVKEAPFKTVQLQCIEDKDICPVQTTHTFHQKTFHLRASLPQDHTFFLAYIDNKDKVASIRSSTVAGWIKDHMNKAGIDTSLYKPHSIRAAASTKAVGIGHSIHTVKTHGNWSQRSNTFEKHYYKPRRATTTSTAIAKSVLQDYTENCTTFEVGAEATRVGLGATSKLEFLAVKGSLTPNIQTTINTPLFLIQ